MARSAETEYIIAALKVEGGDAFARSMRYASASVRDLEGAHSRAAMAGRSFGEGMDNLASKVGRASVRIGGLAAVTSASLVKMGLNFDAMIERSQIGTETLVGSQKQAAKITKDVRKFALEAPLFGTEQMMKTSQQLIGAGYDAKNVVPYLRTFSDTLSALGRRPEDLQRMTYAFVQMMSKGQISAEELRGQLGEIFPAQKILAREMGLTTDEFAKQMKKGSFKGKEAIFMLLRGMEKDFGGATAKMAKTFDGQLANIRESAKYTLGIVFMPLFEHLRDDIFPVLQDLGKELVDIFSNKKLTAEEKFENVGKAAKFWLGPIWDDFLETLDRMDIGQHLGDALQKAMPSIIEGAKDLGKEAAKQFGIAFINADIWGKLFLGAIAFKVLGGKFASVWGMIGRKAGQKMGRHAAASTVANEQMTLFGGAGERAGGRFARGFSRVFKLGMLGLAADVLLQFQNELRDWLESQDWYKKEKAKNKGKGTFGTRFVERAMPRNLGDAWRQLKKGGLPGLVAEEIYGQLRPKRATPRSGVNAFNFGAKGPGNVPQLGAFPPAFKNLGPKMPKVAIHNHLYIDGKQMAIVVGKINQSEMRRR